MTPAEILTLIIASLSLVISLIQVRYYGKEIKIIKQQYDEQQAEREKNVLDISVWHSNRWGGDPESPLKWIGVWLRVNNRSDEQPLLVAVDIELHLIKEQRGQVYENPLVDFIKSLFEEPKKAIYSFSLYSGRESYSGYVSSPYLNPPIYLPHHFYLMDWETKAPIVFAPQKEFRMQLPKEKRIWLLFGIVPDKIADKIMKTGLSVDEIQLIFATDQGEIKVSEKLNTQLVSEELLKEYLRYESDFKQAISAL